MTEHDCQEMLGQLSEYLDGEATAVVCEEIERHLENCADCRVVVDTLQKTILLYRGLPQPSLPDPLRLKLYHTLDIETVVPATVRSDG